jgi:hypothetical protein
VTHRLVVLIAMTAWAASASARPTDVIHPGGVPAVLDTLVLDFPVLRSPSLLSLVAPSALAPPVERTASAADSAAMTWMRREESRVAGIGGIGVPPAGIPGAAPVVTPGSTNSQASLLFSGSKSVAVEMGRGRDASLHQTLDLTVRGRVAGDVELSATLSDQALPFEPDGTTRELQDLDRLFLSVRAPQGEVTMGDFRLDVGPCEFSRLQRQLQGVRGQAKVAGSTWDVAAASAKGQRGTIETKG